MDYGLALYFGIGISLNQQMSFYRFGKLQRSSE